MVEMKHVTIYGMGNDASAALLLLTKLECFHPNNTAKEHGQIKNLQDNPYETLFMRTTGLLKDLNAKISLTADENNVFAINTVKNTVDAFVQKLAQKRGRKAEIETKIATYEQTKTQLKHLTNLHTNIDEIFAFKYLKVRFGRLPKDSFAKLSYYEDKAFTFLNFDLDDDFYWGVYFTPEIDAGEVDAIFASLYFERLWVPDFVHGTPQDALEKLIAEQKELEEELKDVSDPSQVASESDIKHLQQIASWLNMQKQIFDLNCYVTVLEQSYSISGFVSEDSMATLQKQIDIQNKTDEQNELVMITDPEEKRAKHENRPVKLKNSKFAAPFESYVKMYGLPTYGDVDPTNFVAITYAVLFGAMFADIGQGLVLGIIGYFVMYKKLKMDVGLILARCSVFSIFFGFIFGSLFGFEHIMEVFFHDVLHFYLLPIVPLAPANINGILIGTIAAGIFIISAAMATGIYGKIKARDIVGAVFNANGVAGLLCYVSIIAVVAQMGLGVELVFVGSIAFYVFCIILPILIIYFSEPLCEVLRGKKVHETFGEMLLNGFFELFHVFLSYASNTMSFLRVGGFILVHAGMMSVVHTLAALTTNTVITVIIYIIGNIVVIGIEGLFVSIQVLRLEFYEVFSRFFEGKGIPFKPIKISTSVQ